MERTTLRRQVSALAVFLAPAAFAALAAPQSASAAPPGYFVDYDEADVQAERPESVEETDDAFSVSVRRAAFDSLSVRLLAIAESTYPDREPLVANALEHRWEMGPDTSRAVVWWSRGVGPNRIPQAVTWRAVRYYADLCERYRMHVYSNTGTRAPHWAELAYWATIDRKDRFALDDAEFHDVFVANLHLYWGVDDGAFDMNTVAHRVVVLSPDGKVLQVTGDAPAEESVMISGWREATEHSRRGR